MSRIPSMDSVAELARFWDDHDVTEFEGELEEVAEPVFERAGQVVMRLRLDPAQADALHRMATSKGLDDAELIREWVDEKLETR